VFEKLSKTFEEDLDQADIEKSPQDGQQQVNTRKKYAELPE